MNKLLMLLVMMIALTSSPLSTAIADTDSPGLHLIGSLDPQGSRVYICDSTSKLVVVELGNGRNPEFQGSSYISGGFWGFAVVGKYLYSESSYAGGMQIYDVINPREAREVAKHKFENKPDQFAAAGNILVVGAGRSVQTLDIQVPKKPRDLGSWSDDTVITDIELAGRYAYVAARTPDSSRGYLYILDLSDPAAIRLVGRFESELVPRQIVPRGDVLYASLDKQGIAVFAVGNPEAPTLAGTLGLPGRAISLVVHGTTAYVLTGKENIHVVDCTDPAAPVLREAVKSDLGLTRCAMLGDLIIGFGTNCGIRVFRDLGAGTAPIADGSYPGRVYTRPRSDSSYGADSFIFLDGTNMTEFPLISPDPPNAFRFVTMSPEEIAAQPLMDLVAGKLSLKTNMSLSKNILAMEELSGLEEFHSLHLKDKDLYDLQGSKSEIIAGLQEVLGLYQAEAEKAWQSVFYFEGSTRIREKDYDFDTGMLTLHPWLFFMPAGDSRSGWDLRGLVFPSPFTLACDGPTMKATFGEIPGEFGEREVKAKLKFWLRPTDRKRVTSVYDTMTNFIIEKIIIETETQAGLQTITIDPGAGSWQPKAILAGDSN